MPAPATPLDFSSIGGILGAGNRGLGDALPNQRDQETEEEKRKKRLGLGAASQLGPAVADVFGGLGGRTY